MISEEPLIDQERQKDEEYLVIVAFLFVNNYVILPVIHQQIESYQLIL